MKTPTAFSLSFCHETEPLIILDDHTIFHANVVGIKNAPSYIWRAQGTCQNCHYLSHIKVRRQENGEWVVIADGGKMLFEQKQHASARCTIHKCCE